MRMAAESAPSVTWSPASASDHAGHRCRPRILTASLATAGTVPVEPSYRAGPIAGRGTFAHPRASGLVSVLGYPLGHLAA